ncbi:MAG TPA: PHP domain-containing protein [Polyangiales bacterium]
MRCDLHMHSRCSDGSLEVEQLVEAVHAAGVSVFALTDHDTLRGLPAADARARQLGLTLIPGVEISTRLEQVELHILGYGFDPAHPGLDAALAGQREAREGRIPRIVERLNQLGLALTVEDVYRAAGESGAEDPAGRSTSLGRPHVARALVAMGYVQDTDDAFRRYLGDGGPAQIQKRMPEPKQAIAWIHAAGGKAVWAHPLARNIQRPGGFDRLLRELKAAGLDGVEEVHPAQQSESRRRIRKLARELGLVLTGGSDFHGEATPGVSIGSGRGQDSVPASVVDSLLG